MIERVSRAIIEPVEFTTRLAGSVRAAGEGRPAGMLLVESGAGANVSCTIAKMLAGSQRIP